MDTILSDLRGRPAFGATVADRIWRAWWKPAGIPLDHVTDRVAQALSPSGFLLMLVPRGRPLSRQASLIASDLAARPYTPWVAAVWVDPDARRRGIGSALVRAISDKAAFALGFDRLHLCANPDKAGFYAGRGWTVTETGVGTKRSNIMTLDPVSAA